MSKQDIRVVIGQIAIIYEIIQEKGRADTFDLEMYRGLIKKFHAINAKLDKTMWLFDPLKDHLDIKTVNSYVFYEDYLTNMKHWTINCEIRKGQISVLKKLIEKKSGIFEDEDMPVEINKLRGLSKPILI